MISLYVAVPSQPLNITATNITNTSVTLHWLEPHAPNGIVTGYRLYYMKNTATDVMTIKENHKQMSYTLINLGE